MLLDGQFMTENDQGYNRVCLAEVQVDAEKFIRTRVFGLCGNPVCKGQMAQRDDIVCINPMAL